MAAAGAPGRPGLRCTVVAVVVGLATAACSASRPDPADQAPPEPPRATASPSAGDSPTPAPSTPEHSPTPDPLPSATVRTLPSGVVHASAVAYGPHERQALDTYVPAPEVPSPTGDPARRPAMLLVHGGGWSAGHRGTYHETAVSLAARGWVAVTVGYRLAPAHRHPDAVADVGAALQHVHDHATQLGVDPARVVLAGDSAGGNLSGLVALADERPPVAAWISWSGVHDFVALADQLPDDQAWLRERVGAYLGCEDPDAEDCADRARAASPVTHASADDPPTLLVHSTDEVVPLSDAEAMRRALDDAGVRVVLQTYEGGAHGMQLQGRSSETVEAFLADVLDLQT